jgi:hypothetical protein
MTPAEIPFYGLCIQTGAIVVSAIGVIVSIIWARLIAKRRATLDLLINEQSHETAIKERTAFLTIRKGGDLSRWATADKENSPEAEVLRATINRYELVAIGIRKGIIDEKLYKLWCRTTLVSDWRAVKPFVVQLRSNNKTPTTFCEAESIAKRWANKEEKPHV